MSDDRLLAVRAGGDEAVQVVQTLGDGREEGQAGGRGEGVVVEVREEGATLVVFKDQP